MTARLDPKERPATPVRLDPKERPARLVPLGYTVKMVTVVTKAFRVLKAIEDFEARRVMMERLAPKERLDIKVRPDLMARWVSVNVALVVYRVMMVTTVIQVFKDLRAILARSVPGVIKEILVPKVNAEILEKVLRVIQVLEALKVNKDVTGYKEQVVKMVTKAKPVPQVFLDMSVQKVTVETWGRKASMARLVLKEVEEKRVQMVTLVQRVTLVYVEKRENKVSKVIQVSKG